MPRASRDATADARIAGFLPAAAAEPTVLVIEGEAGIGKTTLWLSQLQRARDAGFEVLTARVGQAESVMAFAALADLLGDIGDEHFASLPDLQRLALDRVLLRAGDGGPATDQRAVAAAFVAVLQALEKAAPVLLAVDDAQWLDTSSRTAIEFAVRRLRGRFGVLATERCAPGAGTAAQWLRPPRPDGFDRVSVAPMDSGRLHTLIADRLGRKLPRPTVLRISEISGGNPFFALELARAHLDGGSGTGSPLPATLTDVVRRRIGSLALHPTCSSVRLGLDDALLTVARAVADEVVVPEGWQCCGFAGDRGLLHPELTASATRAEAAAVAPRPVDGYAAVNRAGEIGLARATGQPYRHVLELLAEATSP